MSQLGLPQPQWRCAATGICAPPPKQPLIHWREKPEIRIVILRVVDPGHPSYQGQIFVSELAAGQVPETAYLSVWVFPAGHGHRQFLAE